MIIPPLWIRYVADEAGGGPQPSVTAGEGAATAALVLSDRARSFVAAIALPRDLASSTKDLRTRRLASATWTSGEIMRRVAYDHRSAIKLALGDLRGALIEAGLHLDNYLQTERHPARYGLHPERTRVDVVELLAARDDPVAVDRLLSAAACDQATVTLSEVGREFLRGSAAAELEQVLAQARQRAGGPALATAPADAPAPPPRTASRARLWATGAVAQIARATGLR